MLSYAEVPGPAPAVICIPGFAGHSGEFAAQAAHFGGRHRVIALDAPAAGDVTIAGHAAQVAELARSLGVRGAAVVGHSLGGLVGLELATREPALVSRVVLLDSLLQLSGLTRAVNRALLQILRTPIGPRVLLGTFARGFDPADPEDLRADVLARVGRVPSRLAYPSIDSMYAYRGMSVLSGLMMPCLYIRATLPTRLDTLPGSVETAEINGAGHWIHRRAPAATNARIQEFLGRPR